MSKLEIVREEDSKFNDVVKLDQEVTPDHAPAPKKEGRIKRMVAHFIGPDGFKAVVRHNVENQLVPALKFQVGNFLSSLLDMVYRGAMDLAFGIGTSERMTRNGGGYGGFGFSGTGFRFNGATNPFHKGINGGSGYRSQWDSNITDAERKGIRNDLYTRNARVPRRAGFDSYEQAADLLQRLGSHAATLGYITVANYHELNGYDTTISERDFGWYLEDVMNLTTIEHSTELGYYLNLPPSTTLRR